MFRSEVTHTTLNQYLLNLFSYLHLQRERQRGDQIFPALGGNASMSRKHSQAISITEWPGLSKLELSLSQ